MSNLSAANPKISEMSRTSVKIAPGAVVCSECELRGDITIGQRTVIHPKARILAEAGPIIIGDGNLIEEVAVIHNRPDESNPNEKVMIIGSQNIFEVGSRCEAVKVGDFNVLEARSFVSRDTVVSNGCTIGAMCSVTGREVLPDNCVVYGAASHRKVVSEKPPAQTLQLDFLAKILPNFHHIKKAGASSAAAAAAKQHRPS